MPIALLLVFMAALLTQPVFLRAQAPLPPQPPPPGAAAAALDYE